MIKPKYQASTFLFILVLIQKSKAQKDLNKILGIQSSGPWALIILCTIALFALIAIFVFFKHACRRKIRKPIRKASVNQEIPRVLDKQYEIFIPSGKPPLPPITKITYDDWSSSDEVVIFEEDALWPPPRADRVNQPKVQRDFREEHSRNLSAKKSNIHQTRNHDSYYGNSKPLSRIAPHKQPSASVLAPDRALEYSRPLKRLNGHLPMFESRPDNDSDATSIVNLSLSESLREFDSSDAAESICSFSISEESSPAPSSESEATSLSRDEPESDKEYVSAQWNSLRLPVVYHVADDFATELYRFSADLEGNKIQY